MILVDSCVWIDLIRKNSTPETSLLKQLASQTVIAVADIVLLEVLQGISPPEQYQKVKKEMMAFEVVSIGGKDNAVIAAEYARALRMKGLTASTIDTLIASWCITNQVPLLTSDRIFDQFRDHLGMILVQ